jgi:hypothetical protein
MGELASVFAANRSPSGALGMKILSCCARWRNDGMLLAVLRSKRRFQFIPSRGGVSHSPKEYSSWEQIAGGAEVL